MSRRPPRIAEWVLRSALPRHNRDAILGDLMEQYATQYARGRFGAIVWYWMQVVQIAASRLARPDSSARALSRTRRMVWDGLLHDLRYAIRTFWRMPAFSLVAIVTLALGVGATTAIVSVTYDLVIRPLSYARPGELVHLWSDRFVAYQDVDALRDVATAFEAIEVVSPGWTVAATGIDQPTQLKGARVSAGLFELLGVPPSRGRGFLTSDDDPGAPAVGVLSEEAWRSVFGSDHDIIGRTVVFDGVATEIVGVMPAGFEILQSGAELWLPLEHNRDAFYYRGPAVLAVARLVAGQTVAAGRREFTAAVDHIRETFGYSNSYADGASLTTLHESIVGDVRPTMVLLVVAAGFILLIAGANLANLLLTHGASRQREIALRSALGATRGRLVMQLMMESAALTCVGVAAGSVLAVWGVRSLRSWIPSSTPRLTELSVNVPLLVMAALVAGSIAAAFALLPAFGVTRNGAAQGLRIGDRAAGTAGGGLRNAVVITQIAVAFILVVGAGLMIQTLWRLNRVDPGFRASGILTVHVQPSAYESGVGRAGYYRELFDRVASLPGVDVVGAIQHLPLTNFDWTTRLERPDRLVPEDEQPRVGWRIVNETYFDAMGIGVRRGRSFTRDDGLNRSPVVIINEEAARRFWPDVDPVGHMLRAGNATRNELATIVGVVGNVRHVSLDAAPRPEIYRPIWQYVQGSMALAIRTSVAPASLAGAVRRAIRDVDADVPIDDMRTMQDILAASVEEPRLVMVILALFAGVGVTLGAVGIYGVIAYGVTQRRREFGLRAALGARRTAVVSMVLRQGMRLVGIGVLIGGAGAVMLSQTMERFVFGVRPTDPVTLSALAILITLVAGAACAVPAWRAGRVSPMTALRGE